MPLSLGVEGRMDEFVFAALEVLEISFFLCRKLHQHFLGKGSVPGLYLLLCRRMTTREMEGLVVVLQEERGEVSQGVLLTKKSPHTILIIGVAMVKLHGFQFRKLLNQRLVNHQPLIAVPSRCLVFMLSDSLLQKLRHHEIRIAEQGRNAHHRSQHLGEERAAAVAQKQVGLLPVDDGANLLQCLLGVQWQVGSQHHRRPLKRLFQGSRHRTAARGEESV